MRRLSVLLAAATLVAASPALAGPSEDFQALQNEFWAEVLKSSPLLASSVGVKDYDRDLSPVSLAEMDRQAASAQRFLTRLNAIPAAGFNETERANAAILRTLLQEWVEMNRFGQRQLMYSILGSYHGGLPGMAEGLSFASAEDYRNYLARLALVPDRMKAYSDLSVKAAREGYVQPCVTMTRFPETISGVVTADPTSSRFYAPFAAARPSFVPAAEWSALQGQARTLVESRINPAYRQFAATYDSQIKGRCRQSVSAADQPDGPAYYAAQVRSHTTTTMTPEQIHQLGLSEVARIRAEMEQVAKGAGFATREAMIADMRSNPKWFFKTDTELLEATALQAKAIDGKMPSLIGRLARLPYGIRPMDLATAPGDTTARYQPGSPNTAIAGFYLVNTTKLDQRPSWEIPALTVHEAVPGHHQQIALQQELDLPEWRRQMAFFTAFVEGWGLYSERLGIEMGIYDTPQKNMGRLGYEMWRACRLVVDTGLHSKGWSKDKAVQYFRDNSTLTEANIDAEVNRYISNPGQALAYKIGELKIRELRARAEKELGNKFDLRAFHDAVLGQGAIPLDALDAQVNAWIATRKRTS